MCRIIFIDVSKGYLKGFFLYVTVSNLSEKVAEGKYFPIQHMLPDHLCRIFKGSREGLIL